MTNQDDPTTHNPKTDLAALAVGATAGLAAFVFGLPLWAGVVVVSGSAFLTKKAIESKGA